MGARDAIARLLTGIKAYHGSPHSFDRFDASKIGTGEGAQAYGHGLYFAEHEPVARGYRDALSEGKLLVGGQPVEAVDPQARDFINRFSKVAKQSLTDTRANIHPDDLREVIDNAFSAATAYGKTASPELKNLYERMLGGAEYKPGGHMYEVNIKADPAKMLDWDKPLREQQGLLDALSGSRRKAVKETLERQDYQAPTRVTYGTDIGPVTGQDFYKALSYNMTGKPGSAQASQTMQAGGVPGIKYLDEGSRSRAYDIANAEAAVQKNADRLGEGQWQQNLDLLKQTPLTSNYVVFDPANIDILKKYGVVGAPAGALTMGALAGRDQYEVAR